MQNILVVSDVKSNLLMSVGERLKEASYQIINVVSDMDSIGTVKDPICCILLFCDENLMSAHQSLHFIKDRVIEENIPLAIIGHEIELNVIKNIIPSDTIRFEFSRPIHVYDLVAALDRFLKQYSTQNKKKILLVDDSGAWLRTVKGWLEDQYDLFLVSSGTMMIKYLTLNRPDLILLDYEMPICDGRQVFEMIRSETEFADVPVIFLTNKNDDESIKKVMELKPQGYLLKTLEPSNIIHEIDAFFSKQKMLL